MVSVSGPQCDICGKHTAMAIISVEGARMSACRNCKGHGKVIHILEFEEAGEGDKGNAGGMRFASTTRPNIMEREDLVDGYSQLIRQKREKIGLPVAVLAERISEKESFIDHIEKGKVHPTLDVAKKIGKELGIKLVEQVKEEVAPSLQGKGSAQFREPTLADAFEMAKADSNKKKK
ncbi:MAG: multiprotein-bridging factor 1 family protein [Candidatus Micrarchaeota archaeon]